MTANLATPVRVDPDLTYVVSYHTNVGRYSGDQYYFAGKGAGLWAVRALADGVVGGSGVYKYGSHQRLPDLHLPGHQLLRRRRLQAPDRRRRPGAPPRPWRPPRTKAPTTTPRRRRPRTTTKAPATTTTTKAPVTPPPSGGVPCGLTADAKSCWASHTGVPGWTEAQIVSGQSPLVHSVGDLTITQDGTVIDGRWIDGCIAVRASNVVIKNSLIRTTNKCFGGDQQALGSAVNFGNGGGTMKNLQIIDTEIDAGNTPDGYDYDGVGAANYSLLRVNVHGTTHTIWVGSNVTVRDSFIHDPSTATKTEPQRGDRHGLRRATCIVDHSWISAANGNPSAASTGGLFNGGSWGAPHHNQITNNFIEGGNGQRPRRRLRRDLHHRVRATGCRPTRATGTTTYGYMANVGNVWSDNRDSSQPGDRQPIAPSLTDAAAGPRLRRSAIGEHPLVDLLCPPGPRVLGPHHLHGTLDDWADLRVGPVRVQALGEVAPVGSHVEHRPGGNRSSYSPLFGRTPSSRAPAARPSK